MPACRNLAVAINQQSETTMRYLLLLLPFLVLASCASISKEQCRAGDWNSIGFQDGKAGRSLDYLTNHAKACAEVGVTPNRSEWVRGRAQGLPIYCTADNAYLIGRDGHALNNVCPASQARLLARANSWGQDYYQIGQQIDTLEDEQNELEALLALMTGELNDEQKALRRTYRQRLSRVENRLFDLGRDQRRFNHLPASLIADL